MNLRSILLVTAAAVALADIGVLAQTPSCREVSVEGDATYCIQGSVCSGKGEKPTTTGCPKAGDVAVKACLKQLKSYTAADKCVAPVNAECKRGKGDVWGCVWPTAVSPPTPTPATTTKAPTTAPLVQAPPASTAANSANANREISVEGDATYSIPGPICSGKGDKPAGNNCPKAGDVAVKDCLSKLKSYTNAGKCIAPVNAECKKIKTGAWGCVWAGVAPAPNAPATTVPATTAPTAKPSNATSATPATTAPPATTRPPTVTPGPQAPPATTAACREVSVEGDATYCIQGSVCSGKGEKPTTTGCPKAGDVAVKACLKQLKSYTAADKCVAPVNAECKRGKGDVWGCVWPTAASAATTKATNLAATADEATGDDTGNSVAAAALSGGAMVAIAAAAFVFHRKHQQQKQLEMEADLRNDHVTVITP
jgi:hypothetical protein